LRRAHACGHFALRQARFHSRCNQFSGQLKLGGLCVIGLANGGVGQQFRFHVFQAFHGGSNAKGKFSGLLGAISDEHLRRDTQAFV
jgi:hypothetical protein